MSLSVYEELPVTLDAEGNGSLSFTPLRTYGTASVTLTILGGLSGSGFISLGNTPLGPISLAQAFGPFDVSPGTPINLKITGGPTNGTLNCTIRGAIYVPPESTPGQNLQFSTPLVQNSNVLVYATDVNDSRQIRYGPFSVAQFVALALRIFKGPAIYTVGLDWFSDQAMTQQTGSTEWTGGDGYGPVSDTWPNLGAWVQLTLTPKV